MEQKKGTGKKNQAGGPAGSPAKGPAKGKGSKNPGAKQGPGAFRQGNPGAKGDFKAPLRDNPRESEGFDPKEGMVEGRNAVLELLRSGRDVDKLYVAKGTEGAIGRIIAEARKKGVPVSMADRRKLDFMSATHAHQGVIALAAAASYAELPDLFALAEKRGEPPLFVICDGITDPHNIGAIIRSAEAAGAHGVIIPKHRSAGLNAVCAKASAGAVSHIPVARVANLSAAIRTLKEKGVFIFGMGPTGGTLLYDADFTLPCAIVIGAEGEGMTRLVAESCDFIVSIPMKGKIGSLNASAAAAVALFEAVRRRNGAGKPGPEK